MTDSGDSRGVPSPGQVSVLADLDIVMDGITARLEGDGQHLVLRSDHPQLLLSSLIQSSLPASVGGLSGLRAVGRAARAMSDAGIHLDVEGPRGTVASIGAGEKSRIGRIATGSNAIQPGSFRSLLPFVRVVAKRFLRRRS